MKSLKECILEGYVTTYQISDINLSEFEKIAKKMGGDQDGLGAVVALPKDHLVNTILGKMFNKSPWKVELQIKGWIRQQPQGPLYDDKIEKILNDNFNFFKTTDNIYLAPKKTPESDVKHWLADEFIGTPEKPDW